MLTPPQEIDEPSIAVKEWLQIHILIGLASPHRDNPIMVRVRKVATYSVFNDDIDAVVATVQSAIDEMAPDSDLTRVLSRWLAEMVAIYEPG